MLVRKPDDEGFGLVEVIIAFFLLAIIAVAILPAVVNGIGYSSTQSSVATATRALNAQIEQLRQTPTCAKLQAAANPGTTTTDGRGATITLAAPSGSTPACTSTTTNAAVAITLTAVQGTTELARVNAMIYLP